MQQVFGIPSIAYQDPAPGSERESVWGGEESKAVVDTDIAFRGREGLDLRGCSTRGEPDFPDGDGPHTNSCEPQGFSMSPDTVHERSVIVE